ncbi:MAG TPA: hypothetical protein VK308_09125 [Pyrinomonadaceae bacterium]|nr:hypothetical protein [Pyrinomonadaceae bacterium]
MKFYFSGISDAATYKMLETAQVQHILCDPFDVQNVPLSRKIGILDSGAFRFFRQGSELDMHGYLKRVAELHERCELIVAPDVINDWNASYLNWLAVKDASLIKDRLIPVWQYGAPVEHLESYLGESRIVGIGGLAKTMREDETVEQISLRERTLDELNHLCEKFPGRFHLFGLNYLKAIEQLKSTAFSCDTSCWIRGASRSYVIFKNTKTGRLTQAPSKAIPHYRKLDREARCILSARNIEEFLSEGLPETHAGNLKAA